MLKFRQHQRAVQPHWRPDFRDVAKLPDIKLVRTEFVVNCVAILVAVSVVTFCLQQEYRLWSLARSVGEMSEQIRVAEPSDTHRIERSELFRSDARAIQDLEKFYHVPFFSHELLIALTELKDPDLIFTNLIFREQPILQKKKKKAIVEYELEIGGLARSLPKLDAYVGLLRNFELFVFPGYETAVSEHIKPRDSTGSYPYTINLRLTPSNEKRKGANR